MKTRTISGEHELRVAVIVAVLGAVLTFLSSLVLNWMTGQLRLRVLLAAAVGIAAIGGLVVLWRRLPGAVPWLILGLLLGCGVGYGVNRSPSASPVSSELTHASPPGCGVDGSLPLNARLSGLAWCMLEETDDSAAVVLADECIVSFEAQALRAQEAFTRSGEPSPPTGQVSNRAKARIHERGLLNDVAACHYIRAMALQGMGEAAEAREAFRGVLRFPDARVWDEAGGFWSPAEGAQNRLNHLR